MNDYNLNNNTQDDMNLIPGFICLTPEEDDYQYDDYNHEEEEIYYNWIDDSECQENLATILPLNPEECIIDSDNHIRNVDGIQLFFEEIGIIYDEPEPIDPNRDYDSEAKILIEKRDKTRKKHIDLSPMPSLDDDTTTTTTTSSSSSFHGSNEQPITIDLRSTSFDKQSMAAYAYSPHTFNSTRTLI